MPDNTKLLTGLLFTQCAKAMQYIHKVQNKSFYHLIIYNDTSIQH